MIDFGKSIGPALLKSPAEQNRSMVVYLEGDLGAGKTTLVKGILQSGGYLGNVTSPTYTLVECYEFDHLSVFHFDLYRLTNPSDIEYLGIRDMMDGSSLVVIEWPSRADGILPTADLAIKIDAPDGASRVVTGSPRSMFDHLVQTRD